MLKPTRCYSTDVTNRMRWQHFLVHRKAPSFFFFHGTIACRGKKTNSTAILLLFKSRGKQNGSIL